MNRVITFLFFLISTTNFAQYQITIDAYVLDYQTNEPIPFSEISIMNKNIATLTNKDGQFKLAYQEDLVNDQDLFIIKSNGYKSLEITHQQLYNFLRNTNKFYLKQAQSNVTWDSEFYIDDDTEIVYGKVFSVSGPIQGASIRIKNTLIESKSDFEGYFSIKANLNDILIVNYLGMDEKQIIIDDLDDKYVLLKTSAEILDEVVLNSSKVTDNQVDTGYGKKTIRPEYFYCFIQI